MPRWRVEMVPMRPDVASPLEIVEAESVTFTLSGAIAFSALGLVIRALAPGQWLQLTLIDDDELASDAAASIRSPPPGLRP